MKRGGDKNDAVHKSSPFSFGGGGDNSDEGAHDAQDNGHHNTRSNMTECLFVLVTCDSNQDSVH